MHRGAQSWRNTGDTQWVTRGGSGLLLVRRPCSDEQGQLGDCLNRPKKNIKRQIGVREKMNSPWSPREITEVMTKQSGFRRGCYAKKGNFVQLFFFFKWKRGWRDQNQLNHHCQKKDKSFIRKHFFACPFDIEEYIWCKDVGLYQNCNMLK